MKLIEQSISKGAFLLDVDARDFPSAIEKSLGHLVQKGVLSAEQQEKVQAGLLDRERAAPTAIGRALAVPHCYLDVLDDSLAVFVRLAEPLDLGAPDGVPTRYLFVLMGPTGVAAQPLDTLTNIARLISDDVFCFDLSRARDGDDLIFALERFNERTTVPKKVEPIPEGLRYTSRLFGGMIGDLRRRLPHYVSDFRDGLNTKTIASVMFLFFACLAPAITFGGIMAEQTGNQIGAVEMIVATALCGIIFAIFSGQPLIILGGTGPLLVFTAILYRLCDSLGIPFLPTYAWVGIWTAIFSVILAATDAGCLMRFFTRFTDETFAALISIIFIYEAIHALVHIFQDLETHQHHATALLSLLLALGTLYIANNLQSIRRSRFLLPVMREFLADFGPTIALLAMTLVALWMHEVDLGALAVPDTLGTTSGRPWVVNPFDDSLPKWVWVASIVPALLVTVLLFLDQNITARLVNSREHKLKKGEAYHWDLAVVGGLVGLSSMFGLPWLVAATVRSLNHLRSLATVEEAIDEKGNRDDRIVHVRENRISPLAIHLLVAGSLLLLPYLKNIPMAVLYGLFLYMGIVSMRGNQFFERMSLWFMDSAMYPATHYVRKVPNWTIHMFTLLQLICLAVLWFVKTSALGILFPLFIALLVPVRMIAGRYFSPKHLKALDSEEDPDEEEERYAG